MLFTSGLRLIRAYTRKFDGTGIYEVNWLISLFLVRELSFKISRERAGGKRKIMRLMGFRDDNYLWVNVLYYSLKALLVFLINLGVLLTIRAFGSKHGRSHSVFSISYLFHYLFYSVIFFLTTNMFSMIMGTVLSEKHRVADISNLIQLFFYGIKTF